ncbi:hypothetical protein RR42_m0211 [Cupriavidus basilensis]|uniref:Uncharacterized protein n=1 Tax=Cupriavidus basilensis TaxID=68895 RepID=A0A0C4YAT7_9BURK|nr:hypothetical protein RR42_m0211 [Cupriavidus basilensis]
MHSHHADRQRGSHKLCNSFHAISWIPFYSRPDTAPAGVARPVGHCHSCAASPIRAAAPTMTRAQRIRPRRLGPRDRSAMLSMSKSGKYPE